MYTLPHLALLVTYAVGGPLLELTSARAVLVVAGLGTLSAMVLIWLMLIDVQVAKESRTSR